MLSSTAQEKNAGKLPSWVPKSAQNYILHTESGLSIRKLAKGSGCHASTVLRQVRKIEARRDDPLVDEALVQLGALNPDANITTLPKTKDCPHMTKHLRALNITDDAVIEREGKRILRRLSEPLACLAVAKDMDKAVVVRETEDGKIRRTASVERHIAQAMALKDWVSCANPGRISRYKITGIGRAALKRLLAEDDASRSGFAEAPAKFGDQRRACTGRDVHDPATNSTRRVRYNFNESPVTLMARRKDKSGQPFLSSDLVDAAERLREDFELAHMGPKVAQNWDNFLTGNAHSNSGDSGVGDGPAAARDRVSEALRDLGPGLGDVVLRVCCFLEGLEAAEKRMGWSARSGKVVLRIALQRLKQHYDRVGGAMIG